MVLHPRGPISSHARMSLQDNFLNENPTNDMYEGSTGGLKWEPYKMWITFFRVRCLQYISLQKNILNCALVHDVINIPNTGFSFEKIILYVPLQNILTLQWYLENLATSSLPGHIMCTCFKLVVLLMQLFSQCTSLSFASAFLTLHPHATTYINIATRNSA